MNLNGKVVAVTGAGQGIGQGIALHLAEAGASIAVLDIDEVKAGECARLCEKMGVDARAFGCNVAEEAQVETVFAQVGEHFGRLDGLVNNAGIARDALLVKVKDQQVTKKMTLQQWQSVLNVNLTGTFLCAREAVMQMLKQSVDEGVIVNISSVARVGKYGLSNYSATKAAVVTLAEVWARELARYNIRTGAVAPGIIETELLAATQAEAVERWIKGIPLQRTGHVRQISQSVQFIFENDYFTGRCIETDGGLR